MANIEEKVETLIKDKIVQLGYELYDVQYVKEGKDFYLKIFIDKPTGIDINDCELVNNEINDILDEVNYINEKYFLEISSTGVEKNLRKDKHLSDNIGELIEIKLYNSVNKKKQFKGILKDFNSEILNIEVNNVILSIERKNISIIKTVFEW